MAIDRYPESTTQTNVALYSNYLFYVVFLMEMMLKLIGLGPKCYFHDHFNLFDAFIILVSTLDIILSSVLSGSSASSSLSVLRGFRILRLLKIIKSWEKLQELLATIANTLKDLRNFLILLFICMFAFTLLGL
jgi:hypothetical protein